MDFGNDRVFTIKSFITLDNSRWFKEYYETRMNRLLEMHNNLEESMEKFPDKQFFKFGTNQNRLKQLKTDIDKLKSDPYCDFLCSRGQAKEAFLKYGEIRLLKYYIMSVSDCTYGEMRYNINRYTTMFKNEEKLKEEIIKSFPPVYNYTKISYVRCYNFDFLDFVTRGREDEYISITDLLNITDIFLSDLEKMKRLRKEFIFKKTESGEYIKK